jgi:cytochrome c oxidase subunit 1
MVWDWLTTTDHKKIGTMYGLTALLGFLIGGLEALVIRMQLAVPQNDLITSQTYNQLFTMHGTTMVFLAIMPMSAAFFNYIMPLQVGARDVAFPRLNAFSLWAFIAGFIILNVSWMFQWAQAFNWFGFHDYIVANTVPLPSNTGPRTDVVPSVGWFAYAPITSKLYSGIGTDFWIVSLQILGVASIAASLNFIVTIVNMRAPGLTMMRLPVFSWMTLITSFLIILAFPAITIALVELMFDRFFGTNFYNVLMGGQPILWQHLFWIFGHPEVYILILPAMGIISEVLPTFSRKPLFGYAIVVFSGAVIGFLGFAVWSHHMFTTGLGKVANAAFALLTMAIAVPTGVKIFNWIGTLWGGRIRFTVSMVFACGFIWMFMLGGFSGIMHSAAPADAQQQDSYFVVAHFHYVLIGGSILAVLSGIYYWFPKMTGRFLSEKIGYWVAGLVIVGFNITFFPMHYLGLNGMPRRTHSYLPGFGWETWNLVCTVGACILGFGILVFVINFVYSIRKGKPCGDDPWNARTLEWAIPNPPPIYNFARLPIIKARDPLWAHKYGSEDEKIEYEPEEAHGIHMPSQSWWPLAAGIGLLVAGLSMALHIGIGGIVGLVILLVAVYLWALEGPGGYHLKPAGDPDDSKKPTPVAVQVHS